MENQNRLYQVIGEEVQDKKIEMKDIREGDSFAMKNIEGTSSIFRANSDPYQENGSLTIDADIITRH